MIPQLNTNMFGAPIFSLNCPTNIAVDFLSFSFCILEVLVSNLRVCHLCHLDRRPSSQVWNCYLETVRCCLIPMSSQLVFKTIPAYLDLFHTSSKLV